MRRIVKGLFVALNFVAVLLLLASTLSGSVPPSRSMAVALLSYAYFPLLLLNAGCILLWLFVGRWWFLLSTAAILLRYSFIPLYFQWGGDKGEMPQHDVFTVLTNNVHGFYGSAFVSDMDKDLSQIARNGEQFLAIVDSTRPDVLCLQEYRPRAHTLNVSDSLLARGYRYRSLARPGRRTAGTIVWSRYPLCNRCYLDSADMMAVDVVKGDDTLRLVNVHLESYRLDEEDYRQVAATWRGNIHRDSICSTLHKMQQAALAHERQWHRVEPVLQASPHPCLLAGDFNDTPASYFYQRARHYLADSYVACGDGFGTTYHGTFPAFRIDYLLCDVALTVLDYHRFKSSHSDHYPLVASYHIGDTIGTDVSSQQE